MTPTPPPSPPPVLHMVCGKIGAGKSTLTRRLAQAPATVCISEDTWLAALYPGEIHALPDYVRAAGRLKQAMGEHVCALLGAGVSVVLDFPANTVSHRAWARGLFEQAGAAHQLHFLDVPDEVCKARLRARNAAGASVERAGSMCIGAQLTDRGGSRGSLPRPWAVRSGG